MNLTDLKEATKLARRLDKLDRKRAKLLRALAALGIDTARDQDTQERSGTAREASSTQGERVAKAIPVGTQFAAPPPIITEAEAHERALKTVLASPYASWRRGEIDDDDWAERQQRYAAEIRAAKAEILAGQPEPDKCTICQAPATLIVMGDPFCAEHRPRPMQIVAMS